LWNLVIALRVCQALFLYSFIIVFPLGKVTRAVAPGGQLYQGRNKPGQRCIPAT